MDGIVLQNYCDTGRVVNQSMICCCWRDAEETSQFNIIHFIHVILLLDSSMAATLFVQPLDLVKNRMQLSGEGGKARQYRNTFHALTTILKSEGITGIYTG